MKIAIECIKNLNKNICILTQYKTIHSNVVIPKNYPWPRHIKGIFSQTILSNKHRIEETSNFNVLTLFHNSNFLEMISFIASIDCGDKK